MVNRDRHIMVSHYAILHSLMNNLLIRLVKTPIIQEATIGILRYTVTRAYILLEAISIER